ncbi:Uncharacterized protein K02A2.6 [Eumeta japonica]|uniref:RNA-directed DNA polymerase n=1 Tax=Eumeta variegata TaxID=151549 RepID=A0A4C1UE13_EUMVA|nr:Uncharacterized protein K02A2.6 [Eumeta japonica]
MDVVGGASERFRNGKTRLGIGTGVSALRPAFIHRAHGRRESDGPGAVLAQQQEDGSERVIAFASRALTPRIPEMTANRLQRYALFLSAYNYTVQYVVVQITSRIIYLARTRRRAAADGSGAGTCAASVDVEDGEINSYLHFISSNDQSSITIKEIKAETQNDPMLHSVVNFIRNGWPRKCPFFQLKPYYNCRFQLNVEDGCILRGHKVVIPLNLQGRILRELHSSHFGVVKTKAEARRRFWWPGIDADIESAGARAHGAAACPDPRATRALAVPRATVGTRSFGYAKCGGRHHLLVVDAHSKWVEWAPLADGAGTEPVLRRLSEMLGRFGLPRTIVTDNATPFTSARFRRYCEVNDIKHVTIPPYHPASNGQAEITVKLIKRALKLRPVSPAQLMLGRNVRTRLDLLCPRKDVPKHVAPAPSAANLAQSVSRSQISQSKYFGGNEN